jgi:hypothetical protein
MIWGGLSRRPHFASGAETCDVLETCLPRAVCVAGLSDGNWGGDVFPRYDAARRTARAQRWVAPSPMPVRPALPVLVPAQLADPGLSTRAACNACAKEKCVLCAGMRRNYSLTVDQCCQVHHAPDDALRVQCCSLHRLTRCGTCANAAACCRRGHHTARAGDSDGGSSADGDDDDEPPGMRRTDLRPVSSLGKRRRPPETGTSPTSSPVRDHGRRRQRRQHPTPSPAATAPRPPPVATALGLAPASARPQAALSDPALPHRTDNKDGPPDDSQAPMPVDPPASVRRPEPTRPTAVCAARRKRAASEDDSPGALRTPSRAPPPRRRRRVPAPCIPLSSLDGLRASSASAALARSGTVSCVPPVSSLDGLRASSASPALARPATALPDPDNGEDLPGDSQTAMSGTESKPSGATLPEEKRTRVNASHASVRRSPRAPPGSSEPARPKAKTTEREPRRKRAVSEVDPPPPERTMLRPPSRVSPPPRRRKRDPSGIT